MLKSPTYTSVQTSKSISGTAFGIADRLNKLLRGGGDGAARGTNKENASSNEKARDANSKLSYKDGDQSDSASLFKSKPDAAVSKAPSSLASSSYQAHGYLPQFDGAGKSHTASLHQYQGNGPPSQQVRVILPSSTSYAGSRMAPIPSTCQDCDDPSADNRTAAYLTPVNFGYDGGSDARPPAMNDASTITSQSHPKFDHKGVTAADYEIQRESPNNEWHRGAVEDYFQEIAANERQEMTSVHQYTTTKSHAS